MHVPSTSSTYIYLPGRRRPDEPAPREIVGESVNLVNRIYVPDKIFTVEPVESVVCNCKNVSFIVFNILCYSDELFFSSEKSVIKVHGYER